MALGQGSSPSSCVSSPVVSLDEVFQTGRMYAPIMTFTFLSSSRLHEAFIQTGAMTYTVTPRSLFVIITVDVAAATVIFIASVDSAADVVAAAAVVADVASMFSRDTTGTAVGSCIRFRE